MSGIVSGMNYNLLFSPPASTTSGADILTALYSGSSSFATHRLHLLPATRSPISRSRNSNVTSGLRRRRKTSDRRRCQELHCRVAKAPDIKTALADPAVQKVLLTANGLSSFIGQTALVQKLLLSDPSDPNSLGQQIR